MKLLFWGFVISVFVFSVPSVSAQKSLKIYKTGLLGTKEYELFVLDKLVYKRKGKLLYNRHKITNMGDSVLLLDNNEVLYFSDIKKLKINKRNAVHDFMLLNSIKASILMPVMNMGNNMLFDNALRFDKHAVLLTSAFVVSSLYFSLTGYRHVRVNKKTNLKVVHQQYWRLGE